MTYSTMLETRDCEPLVFTVIRRAVVVPLPAGWIERMNAAGIDGCKPLASLVCSFGFTWDSPRAAEPREDFPAVWNGLESVPFDRGHKERAVIEVRADVWQCVVIAAERVGVTPHEIVVRVIGRQLAMVEGWRRDGFNEGTAAPARPERPRRRRRGDVVVAGPWF